MFLGVISYKFIVGIGEESDIGDLGYGLYIISSTSVATTAIYVIGSYSECFVSDGGRNYFGDYNNTSRTVIFGRKIVNGNIYIKNNSKYSLILSVKRILVL